MHVRASLRVVLHPAQRSLRWRPYALGQIGDGNEFGPGKAGLGDLGLGRPDEQTVLAHLVDEVPEPRLECQVQVPDRCEVLQARHKGIGREDRRRRHGGRRGKLFGVGELDSLRALEIEEMAQRLLAERQQHQAECRAGSGGPVRELRGRDKCGDTPSEVSMFAVSARCSISSRATPGRTSSPTVNGLQLLGGERGVGLILQTRHAANRYSPLSKCSTSAASQSCRSTPSDARSRKPGSEVVGAVPRVFTTCESTAADGIGSKAARFAEHDAPPRPRRRLRRGRRADDPRS